MYLLVVQSFYCREEGTKLFVASSGSSIYTSPKLSTVTDPGISPAQLLALVYYRLNYPLSIVSR